MDQRVEYEKRGAVGVITVNNPPVNPLSVGVPGGVIEALDAGLADPEVSALVVRGAGRTFIAGADIKQFGKPWPEGEPTLRDIITRFDGSPKPVIAAIHGVAFGGGLELAMACHWRCATPDARVGQPEVKIGIPPGAGGTQRLPRLAGVEAALDMIVTGDPIGAARAKELGVIDGIVEGDLTEGAVAFATRMAAGDNPLRRTRDLTGKLGTAEEAAPLFAAMRKRIARRARGQTAPWKCIDAVELAVKLPFDEGIAGERKLFEECVTSPEAYALRHAFFAERAANKVSGVTKETPVLPVNTAGVVGFGTMGGGIAMCFANAGIPVTVVEQSQEFADKGFARVRANYEVSVKRGKLDAGEVDKRLSLITPRLEYEAVADADFVIEAVFEEIELKKDVFRILDDVCNPGAIIATNTSYQDVNAIAAATARPGRVLGTHFFSPANVMRLLEIVRGAKTDPEVLATTIRLGKTLGKVPVVVGVCHGFVGNRMLSPYMREANFLLEEGALPQDVDQALFDFGMPMGPFAVGDLAGLDIGWAVRKAEAPTRPKDRRYSPLGDRLCERGRFGQKTGAGWYRYEPGSRTPVPDPEVERLIVETSAELGITRRDIGAQEIIERCIYALVNEGARILAEGIAERASDIDTVWINGYGFPAWRGGPMYYADSVGPATIHEAVERFHAEHGVFWEPAPLLAELARSGGRFGNDE